MPSARQSISMEASPEAIMAVITDFAAYPTFLPEIASVDVLHAEPGIWEVRFTIQVIRKLNYTLRLARESPHTLSWSLLEGVFRSTDGGWSLTALEDGITRADYRIDVQMGIFVPGNIVHSLVDRGLPQTLSRFKTEVERRSAAAG